MVRDGRYLRLTGLFMEMRLQALCRHRKVLLAHDVVPVENTPSFVSRECHSDPIGDSRSHHVAHRSSAQIVNQHFPTPAFLHAVAHDRLKSPTCWPSRW